MKRRDTIVRYTCLLYTSDNFSDRSLHQIADSTEVPQGHIVRTGNAPDLSLIHICTGPNDMGCARPASWASSGKYSSPGCPGGRVASREA